MIVIADTSFVVSGFFSNDSRHKDCVKVYQQQELIYLPQSTLAEVMYLLGKGGGNLAVASFLDNIFAGKSKYQLIPLELVDLQRTTSLLTIPSPIMRQLDLNNEFGSSLNERAVGESGQLN